MFTKVTEQRFKGHFSIDCYTIRAFCNQRRRPLLAIKNKVCELQFFPHFLPFFVVVMYIKTNIKNKQTKTHSHVICTVTVLE